MRFVTLACLCCWLCITVGVSAQDASSGILPASALPVDELGQLRAEVDMLKQYISQPTADPVPLTAFADDSEGGLELFAGYDVVFAKPHIKESFQTTTLNVVPPTTLTLHPFEFDYDPSSRIWIGARSASGVGFRARYWNYDGGAAPVSRQATPTELPGASAVTVIYPANILAVIPGDTLIASDRLAVQTLDLEGTVSFCLNHTELTGAAGLRYAQIEQENSAQVISLFAPGSLNWSRNFSGIGPSLAIDGRHPIGTTGLSVVANARGALLFGHKTIQRSVTGDVTPTPGPPNVALRDADEVTAAVEMGLGAEWEMYSGEAGIFTIRGMYEGQLWTDAGAPTLTFLGFEGFTVGLVWRR